MKTYVDFIAAGMIGLEDGNTQQGQLEINPVVDNREETETIIDKIGDHCEVDAVDSVAANIDFVDPELEADIKAIEEATDGDIMSGTDLFLDKEDPYNEVPGGADLSNDTDETVNGFDDIAEYAEDVNETEVTGTQDNLDEVMREQFDQGENDVEDYAGSITGPADNQEMIGEDGVELDDPTADTETLAENADQLEETNETALDGEEEEIGISEVVGAESDNGEFEEEEEEPAEEVEEEIEEDETEAEEEAEDAEEEIEEDNEEVEDIEEGSDEVVEEEVEGGDDIPAETNCSEEYEMLGSINIKIQDNNYIDDEKMEEIKSEGEEVELGSNSAFAEVSEMRDVNGVDGEVQEFDSEAVPGDEVETPTEIGDGSNMSDVVGEMLAENSHGEDDGYEEGDISADGEGEYSEGEASYDDMNDTSEHDDEYADDMPEESEEVGEEEIDEPAEEEAPEEPAEEPVEEAAEEYEEEEDEDYSDVE